MWILQFLPDWIFTALLLCGVVLFLITKFVRVLPQAKPIQIASIVLILTSIYMMGAVHNNTAWLVRVDELKAKVAAAEAKSAATNTDIVEKTVTKTQVIRERGQDIVKYVDREVVKHDANCVIPKEFVITHNRAAEAPNK